MTPFMDVTQATGNTLAVDRMMDAGLTLTQRAELSGLLQGIIVHTNGARPLPMCILILLVL